MEKKIEKQAEQKASNKKVKLVINLADLQEVVGGSPEATGDMLMDMAMVPSTVMCP
jgi:hypothetical protein